MRFYGWLECVMFGLLLLTFEKVAKNEWMKQVGEMKHIFKLSSLGHAEIIYYAWSVMWKIKLWILRLWFRFVSKYYHKSSTMHSKLSYARANENLESTTFYCSNSVMHQLWTLSSTSNESRGSYLSIHVQFKMQICDYDNKKLHWFSVSFFSGTHCIMHFNIYYTL